MKMRWNWLHAFLWITLLLYTHLDKEGFLCQALENRKHMKCWKSTSAQWKTPSSQRQTFRSLWKTSNTLFTPLQFLRSIPTFYNKTWNSSKVIAETLSWVWPWLLSLGYLILSVSVILIGNACLHNNRYSQHLHIRTWNIRACKAKNFSHFRLPFHEIKFSLN